jgi:hypothetical protein
LRYGNRGLISASCEKNSGVGILARISHTFLLRGGQVLAWLRQTAQFDPQCINNTYPVQLIVFLARQGLTTARDEKCEKSGLATPVRIEADGEPIDISKMSSHAHAGPWLADVDEDGDRDLLVGDFPGYFWFFENIGSDSRPNFTAQLKLLAGDTAAKTPVY